MVHLFDPHRVVQTIAEFLLIFDFDLVLPITFLVHTFCKVYSPTVGQPAVQRA